MDRVGGRDWGALSCPWGVGRGDIVHRKGRTPRAAPGQSAPPYSVRQATLTLRLFASARATGVEAPPHHEREGVVAAAAAAPAPGAVQQPAVGHLRGRLPAPARDAPPLHARRLSSAVLLHGSRTFWRLCSVCTRVVGRVVGQPVRSLCPEAFGRIQLTERKGEQRRTSARRLVVPLPPRNAPPGRRPEASASSSEPSGLRLGPQHAQVTVP